MSRRARSGAGLGRRSGVAGGDARTPQGQGRFPGFDVLGQVPTWDEVTAGVVLRRLGPPEPMRFFTVEEEPIARALFDLLLDQHEDPRIPVLEMVDARLTEAKTDGWHYEAMPDDMTAWHQTLRALDDDARDTCSAGFAELPRREQAALVQRVQDASGGQWRGLPAKDVWSLWTRYACTAFYSHPWAWNEIGFGGPAYPRGYKNSGLGSREPWEVPDQVDVDPLPWASRVEKAKRRHVEQLGVEADRGQA